MPRIPKMLSGFISNKTYELLHYMLISKTGNKQLLDEVEHDIMNDQNRGLCCLPKPKAEADNTDTRF